MARLIVYAVGTTMLAVAASCGGDVEKTGSTSPAATGGAAGKGGAGGTGATGGSTQGGASGSGGAVGATSQGGSSAVLGAGGDAGMGGTGGGDVCGPATLACLTPGLPSGWICPDAATTTGLPPDCAASTSFTPQPMKGWCCP